MKPYPRHPFRFLKSFLDDHSFAIYLGRYQIVKTFILILIFGFLLSLTLLAIQLKLFNLNPTYTYYSFVLNFWKSNKLLFLLVVIVFLLLYTNRFRGTFRENIQFKRTPIVIDSDIEFFFGRVNRVFSILVFVFSLFIAIPIIQLTNTQIISIVAPALAALVSLGFRYLMRRKKQKNLKSSSLSKYMLIGISYNSGSIGNISQEVKEELGYLRQLSTPNPYNEDVIAYLNGTSKGRFGGFKRLFEELTTLLDPDAKVANLRNNITLHERTTDGIHFAIRRLKRELPVGKKIGAIFSDADYPSVTSMIEGEIEKTYIRKIDIRDSFFQKTFSQTQYKGLIEEKITELEQGNVDHIILLLSHVFFETGHVINVDELINNLQSIANVIIIVDGAQAVGNVAIDECIFDSCHFYAFCGHKWLLSTPTIGILYFNEKKLVDEFSLNPEEFRKTNRAFDNYSYDINEYRGTVNPNPLVSLDLSLSDINKNRMTVIEEHNTFLATAFRSSLKEVVRDIIPVSNSQGGGIVTIQYSDAKLLNEFLQIKFKNASGFNVSNEMIRFSFHYYMSIKDVNRLIYAILEFQNNNS